MRRGFPFQCCWVLRLVNVTLLEETIDALTFLKREIRVYRLAHFSIIKIIPQNRNLVKRSHRSSWLQMKLSVVQQKSLN